jgi:large repetitive protein
MIRTSVKMLPVVVLLTATLALILGAAAPASADLIHRYSFTADASDSVGTRNGTLVNGATISAGAVQLGGTSVQQYVDLQGNDIGVLPAATFEVWGTYSSSNTDPYTRIFDFASSEGAGNFLVGTIVHAGIGKYNVGLSGVDFSSLATNTPSFLAVTIQGNTLAAYVNGMFAGSTTLSYGKMSNIGSSYGYLGHATYPNNAYLAGSIDEFRIYNEARKDWQISADYLAGPNTVPEPSTGLLLSGGLMGLVAYALRKCRQ